MSKPVGYTQIEVTIKYPELLYDPESTTNTIIRIDNPHLSFDEFVSDILRPITLAVGYHPELVDEVFPPQ